LDNGSTLSLFGNPKMVTNIRESKTTLELVTNAGTRTKENRQRTNGFPVKLRKKDVAKTPAGDNLFNLGTRAKLDTKRSEIFHTFMAKGLFLCKRARPDIQQAILVLCTRVRDPNQADEESMGDGLIPEDKVIRPMNPWCYTKLDPVFWGKNSIDRCLTYVFWGKNSIDRCLTYGVCQVCCSSGPTGWYCQICENKDVIYVCMLIILKKRQK
jgi:hypothetical protein